MFYIAYAIMAFLVFVCAFILAIAEDSQRTKNVLDKSTATL